MSGGALICLVGLNLPWVLLMGFRFHRAWRNPDTAAGDRRGVLTRRYVDDQFKRPRDESDLL